MCFQTRYSGKTLGKRALTGGTVLIKYEHVALLFFPPHFFPLRYLSPDMARNLELDAEFSAIMATSRSRSTFGGANDEDFMAPPCDGYGPSRIRPKDERASLQASVQTVCFSSTRHLPLI